MSDWLALVKLLAHFLVGVAWPVAAFAIAFLFRRDLKALLPRVRKAGPGGVELDSVEQQREAESSAPSAKEALEALEPPEGSTRQPRELTPLPGVVRTPAVAELERILHAKLLEAPIAEDQRLARVCDVELGRGSAGRIFL